MKPSDIIISMPPLTGVFGRTEGECAAAMLIWYLQTHGDEWKGVTPTDLGYALKVAVGEPVASWAGNPFFRPDVAYLSSKGFITKLDGSHNQPLEFTELGLQRLKGSLWNRTRL
jgi:hypothetical protein